MARFHYKAVTAAGEVIEGEMDARDRAAVVARLQATGHLPIRAHAVGSRPPPQSATGPRPRGRSLLLSAAAAVGLLSAVAAVGGLLSAGGGRRGLSARALVVTTRQMATLVSAGLPLDRCLDVLCGAGSPAPTRTVLGRIVARVRAGATFADALAAEGPTFPPFYISMVRAGEAGGGLDVALGRLADFLEQSQAVREEARSALIYPAVLVALALATVVVLVTVVLPQFQSMFDEAGDRLPPAARGVVVAGDILRRWWAPGLAGLLAAGLILRHQLARPAVRRLWDRQVLSLPTIGPLVGRREIARLSRVLATLIGNGVPLLAGLAMARDTVGNQAIRSALDGVLTDVKEGQGLANALGRSRCVPELALQLIRVGEETGRLETMFLKVADIYEEENRRLLAALLALLVPGLTVGLGLLVAGIIGTVITAMMSIYDLPL